MTEDCTLIGKEHEPGKIIMKEDPVKMQCKVCNLLYKAPTQEEVPKEE